MAVQKPSLAKGTRDFGPEQVQKRRYILNTIETVFKKYGFMPLETPTMENLTTLEGKYGEEGDKLLFRILNSGDYLKDLKSYNDSRLADESFDATHLPSHSGKLNDLDSKLTTKYIAEKGLRYDLTVPFARYVVMNRNTITFPFKRYQMQPVWRADRPQKGRYREFWQCDADVVGSDSLLNEADLMLIYLEVFKQLCIPVTIKYNNRKLLDGLAQILGLADKLIEMTIVLDKTDKIGLVEVAKELEQLGADIEKLELVKQMLTQSNHTQVDLDLLFANTNQVALTGLHEIKAMLKALHLLVGNNSNFLHAVKHDLALARGLSYYTGCIFEVVANAGSLQSSIGGGGRYDNLTGIFGLPNVSGVGISFGLDRIYDVMEELQLFPDQLKSTQTKVLFCYFDEASQQYCLPALAQVREQGIAAEIYPDTKKIGKQLEYANQLNIPFVAIAGEAEMAAGMFNVKNLKSGNQQLCGIADLINQLQH